MHHTYRLGCALAQDRPPRHRVTVHVNRLAILGRNEPKDEPAWRPATRDECIDMPRPCPFVGCRYHLYLDSSPLGSVKFNFGDHQEALAQMPETCSLDVADQGEHDMTTMAAYLNVTPARVQQEVAGALQKLRMYGLNGQLTLDAEDAEGV